MVKEAARNNLGGEESTTFFNNPAVARVSAFITPSCVLSERYMFKLAAHAEILTEDASLDKAAAITAMVIILAEFAPFSLVQSLSPETREVASGWIEGHCKIEGQKQP